MLKHSRRVSSLVSLNYSCIHCNDCIFFILIILHGHWHTDKPTSTEVTRTCEHEVRIETGIGAELSGNAAHASADGDQHGDWRCA
jgi:hypothetical protein